MTTTATTMVSQSKKNTALRSNTTTSGSSNCCDDDDYDENNDLPIILDIINSTNFNKRNRSYYYNYKNCITSLKIKKQAKVTTLMKMKKMIVGCSSIISFIYYWNNQTIAFCLVSSMLIRPTPIPPPFPFSFHRHHHRHHRVRSSLQQRHQQLPVLSSSLSSPSSSSFHHHYNHYGVHYRNDSRRRRRIVTKTKTTTKSKTKTTCLFQSSVPNSSSSSNSDNNYSHPAPLLGIAEAHLNLGNTINSNDGDGDDGVNNGKYNDSMDIVGASSSSINGDGEAFVAPLPMGRGETASLSDGDDNNIILNTVDLVDGKKMSMQHREDTTVLEVLGLDRSHQQQEQQQILNAVKESTKTATIRDENDNGDDENGTSDPKPDEVKFYSLWQRRPGRGESQGNTADDGVSSSLSSENKDSLNKMNSREVIKQREASARKWSEWMISGRKVRDDNNSNVESFQSPSFDTVASLESSSATSSNEGGGGIGSGNRMTDTATVLEFLPTAAAIVSASGGNDVEISRDNNESDEIFNVASPSSGGEDSTVASTTTMTLLSSSSPSSQTLDGIFIVEDKEASSIRGMAGLGTKLFSKNSKNKSASIIGGKSLRGIPGKRIMDKTMTMMTMRRQKKRQPTTSKESKNKGTKLSTKSIPIKRRRGQLREPGRISACDWRQNIINLPSSTILRDVRDPVSWVFVWAMLWSIMYECLKRVAEASSSSVVATLSSGGGVGRAATLTSTTTTRLGLPAVRWLNAAAWLTKHMCLPTVQHTMMVSAVSLLLVFRTNSAYQRFAEGRKIWNDIVDTSRDFSRMIKLYEFAIGTSKCRRINSLLASFPYLLRHRIRPSLMTFYRVNDSNIERDPEHSLLLYPDESLRDTDPELIALAKDEEETGFIRRKTRELCWVDRRTLPWKLIPGSALELCARAQNRPLWVCDRMAKELAVVEDSTTKFTNRERMALIGYVDKLSRSIGACERIHQTVVPMNYARHALRSLTVWLWTLPFVLVKDLGLLTGPVVAVLSWILFGVYEIGSRIEDPFQGTLRLSVYCDAIRRDVLADSIARDTAFILEEEGQSSSEKEGDYDAIFELDSESEEYDGDDLPPKKKKQMMWSFPGVN